MSFALFHDSVFFLLNKKILVAGNVNMYSRTRLTRFPEPAMLYTPELRQRRFVHLSGSMSDDNKNENACAISEGPETEVFTWGDNWNSQYKKEVHYAKDAVDSNQVFAGHPCRRGRDQFNGELPISSACTCENTVVVTAEGGVWYSGRLMASDCQSLRFRHVFNYNMTQIPPHLFGDTKVVQIAAGFQHILAVCQKGCVWGWGDNRCNELGNSVELNVDWSRTPMLVDFTKYANCVISGVAAGDGNSVAVSRDGSCLEWGRIHAFDNMDGCEIHYEQFPFASESYNIEFEEAEFCTVCCGGKFTIALDVQGRVWSQGNGPSGELGLGKQTITREYALITGFPANVFVTEISCGRNSSGAITRDGDVYVWGKEYNTHNPVASRLRSGSLPGLISTPVCLKRRQRLRDDSEIAFLMASTKKMSITPSWINEMPSELFESILRPHAHA